MRNGVFTAACFASSLSITMLAQADIFQWEYIDPMNPGLGKQQSTTLCPGGAGVSAVPSANLSSRNLTMAYMIGADLTTANLSSTNLTNADLTSAKFYQATLAGANFDAAQVLGADFGDTDLTSAQLYSTASYVAHDLGPIYLDQNDLTGWNFAGQNLAGADFDTATLTNADLSQANLSGAHIGLAMLPGANLSQANLGSAQLVGSTMTGVNLSQANLQFAFLADAGLTNADLTGAEVRWADFVRSVSFPGATGITAAQLSSTASYLAHDLTGIRLRRNDLTGIDLTGQILADANFADATLTDANLSGVNLTNVSFSQAILTNANLAGAEIRGASFSQGGGGSGLSLTQLTSTASYLAHDLSGVNLSANILTGADLSGQNLGNTNFSSATLSSANFNQANLTGASFSSANLTNANMSQLNLTGLVFSFATLTGANLAGAEIRGANFSRSTGASPVGGIAEAQLTTTASYLAHDLTGINLSGNLLTTANFSGQNLTNANFSTATLTSANLTGAMIGGANLLRSSGASAVGGITVAQLTSTASYLAKELPGINFTRNNLTSANLAGQNLTRATFSSATFTGVNLTAADVRGASGLTLTGTTTTNLIRTNGAIEGLNLGAGALLAVRDYDFSFVPILVNQQFAMTAGGVLRMVFDEDDWGSTISFAAGVPVTRGGTLELILAPGVDLAGQIGRTFNLFNWTGVSPTGAFSISSPYTWDLSQLYTTGQIRLLPALAGDFNNDGVVDTADYVVWRKGLGGTYTQADYGVWRAHFGQTGGSGSGASTNAAVPEPATTLLTILAVASWCLRRRRGG